MFQPAARKGSGADTPFLALRCLFEAANQDGCLVHLHLGLQMVDQVLFHRPKGTKMVHSTSLSCKVSL